MSMISDTLIGISLGLVGAFINNFGIVLQKRQINIKSPPSFEEKTIFDIKQFLKDPLWVLGILMQTILYLPFLLLAFDFIGITLLQPISNAGIIFLVLGLILLLNEKLTQKTEYVGLLILVLGVISIALGGVVGKITINIFLNSINSFWIIFTIIIALSAISLISAIRIIKLRLMFLGLMVGNCYAIVAISLQLLTLGIGELSHPMGPVLFILGIVGAIIGTIFGILAAQEAFKRGQAINVVPFTQITMNLFPILAGLFIFQQSIIYPAFFWVGVASIIIGASLLARFEE